MRHVFFGERGVGVDDLTWLCWNTSTRVFFNSNSKKISVLLVGESKFSKVSLRVQA